MNSDYWIEAMGVFASDPSCSNLARKLLEWTERGWTPEGTTIESVREGGEGRVALVRGAARKAKDMLGGGRSNIWTSQPNKNMHPGCGGALLQRSRPGGERRRCGL